MEQSSGDIMTRKYAALFNTVSEGILVLDGENNPDMYNQACLDIWGFDPSTLSQSGGSGDLLARIQEQLVDSSSLLPPDGFTSEHESVEASDILRTRNGRIILRDLFPLRWEGQRDSTVICFRDVTRVVRNQARLHEHDILFRELVENIDESFWVMDAKTREFLYISPQQVKIWGRSLTPFYENPEKLLDITHPDDRGKMESFLESHNPDLNETLEIQYRIIRPDKTESWLSNRAFPVRNHEGEVYRIAGLCEDITKEKQLEMKWKHKAFHDELTGLPTRDLFMDRLNQNLKRLRRDGDHHFAVMFIDVDNLKATNDNYGHHIGDKILNTLGSRLQQAVRSPDTVARVGGDEFLLLAEEIQDRDGAERLLDRIHEDVSEPIHLAPDGEDSAESLTPSVSIGITLSTRFDPNIEPKAVVRRADEAMYRAKKNRELSEFDPGSQP